MYKHVTGLHLHAHIYLNVDLPEPSCNLWRAPNLGSSVA